jgi:two-component system sensor histidine kinase SenX3
VLLAVVAGRSIAQPLTAITTAARAIAAGSPPRFPRSGVPDIDALVQALRQMHRQLGDRFDELRREQAETAALVESMIEGVIAADGRGRIVTANRAARRLLGYGPAEPLPDLAELFRVKAAREVVDAVMAGEPVEDRRLDMDGRAFMVNARPLPTGGAVLVIHDLTEIRRLEAVRRDFVTNISHELKTPVGALGLLAETIADEDDPAVAQRLAERMLYEATRVGRTIDDLLELSRIEAEEPHPREPVPVNLVVAEAVERIRPAAEFRGTPIVVTESPRAATIIGDRRQLVSALHNLLDNATKYSEPGSSVEVNSRTVGVTVEIAVRDHGVGIPARDLERIFERFYRVDRARSRETGGTGLGLAIVRHVASNHAGECRVESREGEGSRFTLVLPAGPGAATETQHREAG